MTEWKPPLNLTTTARLAVVSSGTVALLIVYAVLSIGYTHDFLVWNRARWDTVQYRVGQEGIPPLTIEGGLSVNEW